MDSCRSCGCKGCRTCLICEKDFGLNNKNNIKKSSVNSYVYCPLCNKAWTGWNISVINNHPHHGGNSMDFLGVYIDFNFLNEDEERYLMKNIDEIPWDASQSGRRKQNYGPKCNFKRRKLKVGDFKGFPLYAKSLHEKLSSVPILKDFITIEQCSLEYNPQRGASIDPHIDDCWIWGERIITVNLLSDSILTMTYNEKIGRYNLDCVKTYPAILNESGLFNKCKIPYNFKNNKSDCIVRIPMPRRSLLVLYNEARYEWEHRILREDIKERRVCLAFREFTPPYLKNGSLFDEGKKILDLAKYFW